MEDQTRVSNETSPGRSIVIDHPEPASSPENSEPLLQECSDTDSGVTENRKSEKNSKMIYSVNESPPWWECVFLGFQHYMTMFWGSLSVPFLITDNLCIGSDNAVKAELVGCMFFVSGIITILQVLIGVRLPIVQCSTLSLLLPTISYLQLQKRNCPLIRDNCTLSPSNTTCIEKDSPEYEDLWQSQIQVIQGSIMVGSVMEILLGMTGSISLLMKYIGPLSICPTISLLGISLFKASADYSSQNWPVCILTLALLLAFSQYLGFVKIPIPAYSKDKGFHRTSYPLFEMFPVILAVMLAWLVCYILTVTNAIPNDSSHWAYGGRTDTNAQFLVDTPWFSFFYPGKYGLPRVDVALILGLCAGFMASIFESLGDYYACARMAGVPAPPKHAINRGIAIEGFGCLLAGAFGTANGSTSASPNICVIGLTKIASRTVVIHTAVIMIVFAVFNKFGALFVTIPNPIIGASYMVLFGMIIAIGISNLQFVDLNSSRNLFVIGFSFFMGLTISEWIQSHNDVINTGWASLDSMITVLLGTSMFVGGLFGFILDNTIPGTTVERGMFRFDGSNMSPAGVKEAEQIYGLPSFGRITKKFRWTKYLPFCQPPETGNVRRSRSPRDQRISSQLESLELGNQKTDLE